MTFSTRIIAMIVGGIVLVGLIILTVNSCQKSRSADVQSRTDRGQAEAISKASREAIETLGNNTDKAAATDRTVEEGTDAITNAPAGDSNAAADRAACRMRAYRDTDRCRKLLQPAGPPVVGERR